MTLFVDTNSFIQVHDLKNRPWRALFKGVKRIDLVVAPGVIKELDQHKVSTNQRRRDRARAALQLIKEAAKQPGLSLVLRPAEPEVRLVVSRVRPDWSALPQLDPGKPDDQLVAEAFAYGGGAAVFSHDTGPFVSAMTAGILAFEPPEDWLLPRERTDDQREIVRLKAELERARAATPTIVARFVDLGSSPDLMRVRVPVVTPMSSYLVERCVERYVSAHPMRRTRYTRLLSGDIGLERLQQSFDSEELAINQKYEGEVREYFEELYKKLTWYARGASIRYIVENVSGVTASGLRNEITVEGATLYQSSGDAERMRGSLIPPSPPIRGDYGFGIDQVPSLLDTRPRDPVAFYWFQSPRDGRDRRVGALQCEEFRPRRSYQSSILIFVTNPLPTNVRVLMEFGATNMPEPMTISTEFTVEEIEADWSDEWVLKLLPARVISCIAPGS